MTGGRRFVSDLDLPGMLHGSVLRPPVPGSMLWSVDTAPAEKMAGVTGARDGQFIGAAAADPATARRAVTAISAAPEHPGFPRVPRTGSPPLG